MFFITLKFSCQNLLLLIVMILMCWIPLLSLLIIMPMIILLSILQLLITSSHHFDDVLSSSTSVIQSSDSNLVDVSQPIGNSTRVKQTPKYLTNYQCLSSQTSHWCNMVSLSSYTPMHKAFLSQVTAITEPANYT